MKPLLRVLTTIAFIFCILGAGAQDYVYSKVKITIPKSKVVLLQQADIDLDHGHYDEDEGTLTTVLSKPDVIKLSRLGYPYVILVDDAAEDFKRRNKPEEFFKNAYEPAGRPNPTGRFMWDNPSGPIGNNFTPPTAFTTGSMGGYYTFNEMMTKLIALRTANPTKVLLDTIGFGHNGNPMVSVKISTDVTNEVGKPEVLFTGLHHAREPMGMMNLIFFMQYLMQHYNDNQQIKELVDNRSLYFIPCVNPDGYIQNINTNPSGGGMHRKNRRPNANTTNMGVDLNRNYGMGFGYPNSGSSTTVTADNYRGPGTVGFTEPETQAMRAFILAHNIKMALNYHAFGEYWINAYSIDTIPVTPLDTKIIESSGHLMTRYNYYLVGTPPQTVGYNANGASDDWFMKGVPAHPKVYCFSPEIGPSFGGSSAQDFWPNASQIIPIAKEVMFANFQATYLAGSYPKMEDRTSLGVATQSGTFRFTVRQLGLTSSDITVSLLPLQNLASVGGPVNITAATLPNPLDSTGAVFSYSVPAGLDPGQRIRFVVKAVSGGITFTDTITKIFQPTTVFTDNMDAAGLTGWTSAGTGAAWGKSTTSFFNGTRSLVTNTATNYGNNVNATLTKTGNLNLSGANVAYLTFWVRYRAQTGFDKLRILAAPDATIGSPAWKAMPGVHTIAENKGTIGGQPALSGIQDYWVREFIDLSEFVGNNNVGLRFQFQTNGSTAGNGFFIDDIEIYKGNTSFTTLPVSFVSIKAVAGNNNVKVIWQAETNDLHDHFEIERSADGITFTTIATDYGRGFDFSYLDNDPLPGTNYYRVKGVDKDGKFDYSATVSARIKKIAEFNIYPNPVGQSINLKVISTISGTYDFRIISSTGQVLRITTRSVPQGNQNISIPVSDLPHGSYLLQVSNKQEVISLKTFVKGEH